MVPEGCLLSSPRWGRGLPSRGRSAPGKESMSRATPGRLVALAVIVTALPGCDNVMWEGVEVRLERPDPPPGAPEIGAVAPDQEPGLPPLPEGDVVYLVRRSGASASAFPLAQLVEGRLDPLPREDQHPGFAEHFVRSLLPPETELILLADGARVGTFVAGSQWDTDGSYCYPRPRVDGVVELVPGAAEPTFYLALPAARAAGISRGVWDPPQGSPDLRIASLNLAGELMNSLSAPWPASTVAAIRRDLTFLTPRGPDDGADTPPPFAATFMNEDFLRVGEAARNAWSLFYLARHDGTRYRPVLVRYHLYQRDGKAAPRLVAWSDVTGDGREEMVLEFFGLRDRWLALAGYRDGEWRILLEDPCAPEPAGEAGG